MPQKVKDLIYMTGHNLAEIWYPVTLFTFACELLPTKPAWLLVLYLSNPEIITNIGKKC